MNRQARTNCPLGGIFQRDGCSEKSHDPITGHLIDRAFVVVNFMDENFIYLIHYGVGFFGTESF